MQTVLIIDDSPTIRYLVSVYLSGMKIRLVEAGTGRDGLSLAQGGGLSLVIADLRMPGMDGLEFIRQLRQGPVHASLPVILLTSESGPEAREQALEAGASEFLTKPVTLARLRECVLAWILPEQSGCV